MFLSFELGVINLDYYILCTLGLLLGLLLSLYIYRIPWGEVLYRFPPSHYPQSRVSVYPDMAGILLTAIIPVIFYLNDFSIDRGLDFIFAGTLLTVSLIDIRYKIIPNIIIVFIILIGIIGIVMQHTVSISDGLLGFIIGGGILFLIGLLSQWFLKKEGMGGGDIKLSAVCGLFLGAGKITLALLSTAYLAGLILFVLLVTKKINKDQYIPFGPFICAGVIVILLYTHIFNKFTM